MAILLTQNSKPNLNKKLPLVPIRHGVIFPHTESIIQFGRERSIAGVRAAYDGDKKIILLSQKDLKVSEPAQKDLYTVGTLCEIERTLKTDNEMNAFVKGIARVRVDAVQNGTSYLSASYTEIPEIVEKSTEVEALVKHVTAEFKKAVNLGKAVDIMNFMKLMSGMDAANLADQIASTLDAKTSDKQKVLETFPIKDRLKAVSALLSHEIKILEIERKIASKTQKKFDKSMRDNVLRERLKTIQKELGEEGDEDQELDALKKQIEKSGMTKEAAKKAKKELKRLSRISSHNPEAGYIRTWLETLVETPWKKPKISNVSVKKANKVLDEDHYGLEEVKERIIEYLSVLKLKSDRLKKSKGKDSKDKRMSVPTILCFVGAPGVGKTSIGKSIARALDRKFVKISLGGMRDEAEIRGHRRTYVGAMPGRIIQGMKNAEVTNPVFMLDEIDKLGNDFRGDPSSALLEALDPEQNYEFSDHYLEVPYDLSEVFFITTANTLNTIPPALRDRLEIIRFSGYTIAEKRAIAKNYLVKKTLDANAVKKSQFVISDEAINLLITRYTREAGVRSLERQVAMLVRKAARKIAEGRRSVTSITPRNVHNYLGPYKFAETFAEKKDEVGLAVGMAWTQVGGDILFIEVALMPGKGKLTLTGQLGAVMKESAEAAFSYIRSNWKNLGLKKDFYKDVDIHLHIPEGAIPKDGPSAGITLTTAMVSAFTNTPVRKDVSMTGEVTLRGSVLEIGGLKEKVIAAHRAGIKTVVLPENNKKDLVKIPKEIRDEIEFKTVFKMDQVLKIALRK